MPTQSMKKTGESTRQSDRTLGVDEQASLETRMLRVVSDMI